jgi:hypothetical protein
MTKEEDTMRITILYSSSYLLPKIESSLIKALELEGYKYHSSGCDLPSSLRAINFNYPIQKEVNKCRQQT